MNEDQHQHGPSTLAGLSAQSLALGLLWLTAGWIAHIQCWGLATVAVILAWPSWVYASEVRLFERRLWLEQITREDSGIRRWLWSGGLTKAVQALVALAMSLALILLAARLDALHWSAVAADLLLLSLLVRPVQQSLSGQVRGARVALVARRWPLLILNITLLTLAFAALDIFVTATPDTRGQSWHALAETAFRAEALDSLCTPAGWAMGALAAGETLTRHLTQITIPALPDRGARIAAWVLVFGHAGALAYLLTRLQLGVITVLQRRGTAAGRDDPMGLAFVYTILALAIPYLYGSTRLAQIDPSLLAEQARQAMNWIDPCKPDPVARARLHTELDTVLEGARQAAKTTASREIDTGLAQLFAQIEPGVDGYLDWYFTVIGEYERLAALATGDFSGLLADELDRHLYQDTDFAAALESLSVRIETRSAETMRRSVEELKALALEHARNAPCAIGALDTQSFGLDTLVRTTGIDLDRDATGAGVSAGSGLAAAAITTKLLAKKSTTTIAAKLVGKKGFQTAAALAGKAAAKKGGSVLLSAAGGAAVCSGGGPAAVLCGVAAGAATWLAVDKAMVEIDELRLREDMRNEILAALVDQREELSGTLKRLHAEAIDTRAAAVQARLDQTFLPARDGF